MRVRRIVLDYGDAASPELLRSLSALAWSPPYLWTASDETRTRRAPRRSRQRLSPGSPVRARRPLRASRTTQRRTRPISRRSAAEPDGLWICGSHCRVRRDDGRRRAARSAHRRSSEPAPARPPAHRRTARSSPRRWRRSRVRAALRARLAREPLVAPFMHLPTKENGLDIEGLTVFRDVAPRGLACPVVGTTALVIRCPIVEHRRHRHGDADEHRRPRRSRRARARERGARSCTSSRVRSARPAVRSACTAGGRLDGDRVQKPARIHEWPIDGDRPGRPLRASPERRRRRPGRVRRCEAARRREPVRWPTGCRRARSRA